MDGMILLWVGFNVFVLLMLALDLGVSFTARHMWFRLKKPPFGA